MVGGGAARRTGRTSRTSKEPARPGPARAQQQPGDELNLDRDTKGAASRPATPPPDRPRQPSTTLEDSSERASALSTQAASSSPSSNQQGRGAPRRAFVRSLRHSVALVAIIDGPSHSLTCYVPGTSPSPSFGHPAIICPKPSCPRRGRKRRS